MSRLPWEPAAPPGFDLPNGICSFPKYSGVRGGTPVGVTYPNVLPDLEADQNALNVIVVSVRWMPGMSNSFDDR